MLTRARSLFIKAVFTIAKVLVTKTTNHRVYNASQNLLHASLTPGKTWNTGVLHVLTISSWQKFCKRSSVIIYTSQLRNLKQRAVEQVALRYYSQEFTQLGFEPKHLESRFHLLNL